MKILFIYYIKRNTCRKVGAPVGNPTIVAGIALIHPTIRPKIPNFPEISDETPNFSGNLAI